MKNNDLMQVKGLSVVELLQKAKVLRQEISDLTFDKNMKKLKDLRVIFKKRKNLAQVLTIATQKQMLEKLESEKKGEKNAR